MNISFRKWPYILALAFLCLVPSLAPAQYRFDLTPSISVNEAYNDNIDLDPVNGDSDYITTLSAAISLDTQTQHNHLELRYAPTFVWYEEFKENNTVRHHGNLIFGQDLGKHLRFDLTDTFLKSEVPIELTEDVQGVRRTRQPYWRNYGQASLSYLFGPENALNFGYRNSLLENSNESLDDGMIQNAFTDLTYWFDVRNGVQLNYQFISADFSRDDGSIPGDDYTGHWAGGRYLRRFTPHTTGFIGYDFNNREFTGLTEDYMTHQVSIGFDHAFSPDFSISMTGGLVNVDWERQDSETDYSYQASLVKSFKRGRFTLGGRGGLDENYLDAERRGLTYFGSAYTNFEYQLAERLNSWVGGSIRHDIDAEDRAWTTGRGNLGLAWTFLRWFNLSLRYFYSQREDDVETEDYKVHQVMLSLTTSKLYKWGL